VAPLLWSKVAPLFGIYGAKWILFLQFMEQHGALFEIHGAKLLLFLKFMEQRGSSF
jgi:hypothetical protein